MGLTYLSLSCNSIEEFPAAIGDLLVRVNDDGLVVTLVSGP